jgi:hypothetical protein
MTADVARLFALVTAKLEDLHAVAVEGQRPDNSPDMQSVLTSHVGSGLAALDKILRTISKALDGGGQ